jgi:cobalt-zinc-cadmium efflux system membrane fusion protein
LASFDNIEAGELTAQIAAARAELARSRVQQAQAKRQAERSRSLVNIGAVPTKEAEAAEAEADALSQAIRAQEATIAGINARLARFGATVDAGSSNSITAIRSPFDGVVIRVDAGPGAVVDPTSVLMSVADLSRVYVEAQVFEKDLGRIKVGQSTQVRFEAYPNDSFQGRIVAIKDILDPQTRTAGVRVELPNPAGRLRLEMFATIELPTTGTHSALTIPTESVQTVNKRQVVFIKQDSLHFAAREVRTAGDGLTREVVSGLKEGESVVVKGAYQLKSVFLSKEMQGEHEHD